MSLPFPVSVQFMNRKITHYFKRFNVNFFSFPQERDDYNKHDVNKVSIPKYQGYQEVAILNKLCCCFTLISLSGETNLVRITLLLLSSNSICLSFLI